MENTNAFDIFKQEMEMDDTAIRINAVHKLPIVATLMSSDAIKNQLIPYLDSLVKKQDDQVVFAIAQQYGNIATLLGSPQHTIVLPYLEALCSHDETVVRERAVQSISKLAMSLSDNQINNFIITLILRLASNETNFTCRVSATLLMCNIYPRAGPNKQKIRSKFLDISNQQMLLLQRVTATKIAQMCQVYQKEYVVSDLISILKHRSTDQQDQIRVLATESFKSVARVLTRDQNKTYIMPLIIQAADDKSWRVRFCLAKNFTQIAQNFGKQVADLSLIQVFGHLLKDPEVDVKIQAVKSLDNFVKIVSPQRMSVLITHVVALGKDPLSTVRSHTGHVLSAMIKFVPKDQLFQTVGPLIKQLLKDDNQEVRKGGILAATKFIEAVGPDSINSMVPALKAIMDDTKWRVRLQLLRAVADLCVKLNNQEIFMKHLEPLYSFFLNDRAHAIRKLGVQKLPQIVKVYGKIWLSDFFNRVSDIITKDGSYHFKITGLYCVTKICTSTNYDSYLDRSLQLLSKSVNDNVPNIRQVCVKCYHEIIMKNQSKDTRQKIRKQLQTLSKDTDVEVKQRASQILTKI